MNQTLNADAFKDLRRRVAAHEAAHVVVASQFSSIRISGVTITTRATVPRLVGLTSYASPDTPVGMFMTLLVCCAGTCGETILLGDAQPERIATDDLAQIGELAARLSRHGQLAIQWLADRPLTQLDYVGRLFPRLSHLQRCIVTVAYQRAVSMINVNRTSVDLIVGLLMTLDSLTGEQVKNGLQAASANC